MSKVCAANMIGYVENSIKLVSGKNMDTLEFYSILLLLQTNYSVFGCIILDKKLHIVVHLTEVPVLYIPKFNILQF